MDTHLSLFWGQLIGLDQISKLLILRSLLNTCGYLTYYDGVFHDGSVLTNLPTMQETQEMRVQSLGPEDHFPWRRKWQLQCSCQKNSMDR